MANEIAGGGEMPAGPGLDVPPGAQPPAVMEGAWALLLDFRFGYDRSDLQGNDANKVGDIIRRMNRNPSLQLGLDGFVDSRPASPRNLELGKLRVKSILQALIRAGLPAARIHLGAFGDSQLARDRRVAVLVMVNT
jgi:outer membrane protein OmpA-like peptidoglycan-associated protein